MSRSRRRAHEEEEHENHERWLVTYADMVTLLMVLFIVMFAISQVDQKKFAALAGGMAESFGAPTVVSAGRPSVLSDSGNSPAAPDIAAQIQSARESAGIRPGKGSPGKDDAGRGREAGLTPELAAAIAAARNERNSMHEARRKIAAALRRANLRDTVRFALDERGLTISIVTDRVFFLADRADLQPGGRALLDAIAPALRDLPNPVSVEGHTNTVPVAPKYYPTEWELSSARAVTVVRYLAERRDVPSRRLQATGFADTHPLLPASDPRSSTINRRVDIVVLSTLTTEQRAALAAVTEQD